MCTSRWGWIARMTAASAAQRRVGARLRVMTGSLRAGIIEGYVAGRTPRVERYSLLRTLPAPTTAWLPATLIDASTRPLGWVSRRRAGGSTACRRPPWRIAWRRRSTARDGTEQIGRAHV